MRVICILLACVFYLHATRGDLYDIFGPCCHEGVQWSSESYRCDNYPAPVVNISDNDQAACLSIIEVCCIKQTQLQTCEDGKQIALENAVCAIRDADPGAEQFRECCHCCRLGLESRVSQPACQTPGLGEPCDSKYRECCRGEATGNISFSEEQRLTCDLSNPCEQRCIDGAEGVECRCYDGYRLAFDLTSCEDIDECEEGLARCAPSQTCVNTRGSFTCIVKRCPSGYELNPTTGECEAPTPDIPQCQPGFVLSSITGRCEDLNECGLGIDTCSTGERCENTVGSYVCRRHRHCGTGYTLDEQSQRCMDNDECQLGTHNCDGGYRCQNIQGSFRCVPKPCPEGYRFDTVQGECILVQCPVGLKPNEAGNCVDINECHEYGNSICQRHQRCINTRGSYYCRSFVNCPPGYEPSENNGCQDIDECERGTHKCGAEQQCINRQGTYFCQCPRGMRHDSTGRCVDVDECSYGAAICPSNSKCVNTIGSFKCDCVDGLVSDGKDACTDVDECQTDGICQQNCVNVLGTFFCSCNRGYQLRDDKRSCEDIDECTQFGGRAGRSGVCGGRCVNLPGSYRCECPDGWRLKPDARSCEDINECKERTAYCPHSESMCINTRGGYKCPIVRCPEGFAKTNTTGQQNSELIAEEDGVVCGRKQCTVDDDECLHNKTKTISWQFLALPSVEFLTAPLTILNIKTIGYSIYPNLRLQIMRGNDDQMFDTVVSGDKASLRLLRPLNGPAEREVVLQLENRDFAGTSVTSRHVTHVRIFVGSNAY